MVEFTFAQVLAKDLAQAVLDPCRVVAHVGVRHEAELASLAHDGIAETQDAAMQRQIERGFLGAQRRDFQGQDAAGKSKSDNNQDPLKRRELERQTPKFKFFFYKPKMMN